MSTCHSDVLEIIRVYCTTQIPILNLCVYTLYNNKMCISHCVYAN